MYVISVDDLFVAGVAWIGLTDTGVHLSKGRIHVMARRTELFSFSLMQLSAVEFDRYAEPLSLGRVKNFGCQRVRLVTPLENVDRDDILPLVPDGLQDYEVLKGAAIVGGTYRQHFAVYPVDRHLNAGAVWRIELEDEVIGTGNRRLGGWINERDCCRRRQRTEDSGEQQ